MKEIMQTVAKALQENKDENGGYTLEALLVGAVGVALILALFTPVRLMFEAVVQGVANFVTTNTP